MLVKLSFTGATRNARLLSTCPIKSEWEVPALREAITSSIFIFNGSSLGGNHKDSLVEEMRHMRTYFSQAGLLR